MSLPSLFSGPPPDRTTWIQTHAIPFNPQHWLNRLPEPWMLGTLADYQAAGGHKWPQVDRQTLLDTGAQVETPQEAVRFYVMACAWGVGVNQRFVTRRVWVLTRNDNAAQRLLNGILLARQAGAVAAYSSFQYGGENYLKHLGPSFYTKIIYFSGWNNSPGQRPLILDQYVAVALEDLAALGWRRTWNWSPGEYEQYLDLAARWAGDWGTQADVVEKALFLHGKRLA